MIYPKTYLFSSFKSKQKDQMEKIKLNEESKMN